MEKLLNAHTFVILFLLGGKLSTKFALHFFFLFSISKFTQNYLQNINRHKKTEDNTKT